MEILNKYETSVFDRLYKPEKKKAAEKLYGV